MSKVSDYLLALIRKQVDDPGIVVGNKQIAWWII